ncbi:Glyceraldehyde 3-phosphate phosphatase [Candidatus Anstonella stagnisolia]|nr:Glyceraldehyde 3-phosphate phosphatase [Candidatus Anstonella stagnisolia]
MFVTWLTFAGIFMGNKLIGIKAVLFDIDDTLFPSHEFSSLARRNAIRAMMSAGMDAQEEKALLAHSKIVEKFGSNFSRHFNLLASRFPCTNKERAIAAGIAAYHDTKTSIHPFPHAHFVLGELSRRGYPLCIASEGKSLKQWDKLIRLSLDSFFSRVFITSKKSPAFYRACARKLSLSPKECLMVGNHPKKDFSFAQKAGMHAALMCTGTPAAKRHAGMRILGLKELLPLLG